MLRLFNYGQAVNTCRIKSLKFPNVQCSSKDDKSGEVKATNMYNERKFGHNLPCDSVAPCFETLCQIPTGIFRCTAGEMLGPGACKGTYYQNPEYFSFHHMSFYDLHYYLCGYRSPPPKTGRK